jgi:hypothetical protein
MDAKRKAISQDTSGDIEGSNVLANMQHSLKRLHIEPLSHDGSDLSDLPNVHDLIPCSIFKAYRDMYLESHDTLVDGSEILMNCCNRLRRDKKWCDVLNKQFTEMAHCEKALKNNHELASLVDGCIKSNNLQKLFDSPCKS